MLVRPRDAAPTSALALADTSLGFWQQLGLVLLSGVFVLYAGWAQAALSVFSCYRIDEGGSLVPENERVRLGAGWDSGWREVADGVWGMVGWGYGEGAGARVVLVLLP